MLLQMINRAYLYLGVLLFAVFTVLIVGNPNFIWIYLASFTTFVLYGITIYRSTLMTNSFYKKRNLALIVLIISVVEVIIWGLVSYTIDGDLYLFSKRDGLIYYTGGMKMANMSFIDGCNYATDILGYGIDDWGAFIGVSTIFRIIPSLTFLYFCYCIIGTITALLVFDIGRNLLPRRYAFIVALSFSLASFITVFYSVCLKETFMIAIIMASFSCFMTYTRKREKKYLVLTFFFSLLVLLFRTPTSLLLIATFGITYVLLYLKGTTAVVLIVLLSLVLCSTSLFAYTYDRYLRGGDVELIIKRKNELAGEGGIVNQLADPLAALAGPFPSIKVKSLSKTSLYASGLLYRFLLCAPFFLGAYFIIKERHVKAYPFVVFFLINAIGVAVSVKGLETRLSMPHLAMAYIVAFWFLAKHDYDKLSFKISNKMQYAYFVGILGLCLLWNLR